MAYPSHSFTLEELGLDFTELEAQYTVSPDLSTDHILLLDQIPNFEPAKEKAFLTLLKTKLIGSLGTIRENGVYIPKDPETGNCKGFLFIELQDSNEALAVKQALHGKVLDKNHTILALLFSELSEVAALPITEFSFSPEPAKEKGSLKSWLCDEQARDQFVVQSADSYSVYWNEATQPPELVFTQPNAPDHIKWSTTGIYLASFHPQGVMISGGPNFQPLHRLAHPGVSLATFSTLDKFLVTYSANLLPKINHNIIIWDTAGGSICKTLFLENIVDSSIIKWSHDDKYAAYSVEEKLFIMNASTSFSLINNGSSAFSFSIASLVDFSFSASQSLLSYWCMEHENVPAKVAIMELPSFRAVRTKNLFNVSNCQMFWHPESTYLAISVEKSKGKKTASIEVFRLNEKNIGAEFIELEGALVHFSWEPVGDRFAFIENNNGFCTASIYTMKKPVKSTDFSISATVEMALVKKIEKRTSLSTILWNPKGRFFVASAFENLTDGFEFYYINDKEEIELLSTIETFNATHGEWDPSGRYFATFQSYLILKTDNNFTIWDQRGQTLRRNPVDKLKNFKWRPRPNTLLSLDKIKDIKKNLKKYSLQFEEEDRARMATTQKHQERSKQMMVADWIAWNKKARTAWCELLKNPDLFTADKKRPASSTMVSELMEEILEESEEYYD